jgi:ABC-type multidrug transport system ATPase subunit
VGAPELLFLDEPTTGFNPAARHRAWDLIRQLCRLGTTVLLTTHYLEEAQELADWVAVLRAGRVVAQGTPDAPPPVRWTSPERSARCRWTERGPKPVLTGPVALPRHGAVGRR